MPRPITLIERNLLHKCYEFHYHKQVKCSKLIIMLKLKISRPTLKKLLYYYNLAMHTKDEKAKQLILTNLFPEWLTDSVQTQPKGWKHNGIMPLGEWTRC